VASLYGWNPIEFLALTPEDARIALAVLEQRTRIQEDVDRTRADYLAGRTAERLVPPLIRWLARNLPKLTPRV